MNCRTFGAGRREIDAAIRLIGRSPDLAHPGLQFRQEDHGEPASRRRCVLFLIPTLGAGGAERVFTTLIKHLDRRRFRVILAVVTLSNAVFFGDIPEDVELIDLGVSRVRYALGRIISLVWRRRPDVVFSTLGHLNLALAICRPLLPREVTFIARETHVISLDLSSRPFPAACKALISLYYRHFDIMVCQSRHMQRELIEMFGLRSEKTIVINNPVDIARIRRQAAEPVSYSPAPERAIKLVAAGRLVEVKGFDLLIEAIALLDTPAVQLVILGDGPLRDGLAALAEARGVAAQIHFAGHQSNPYAWFARADAFVLASRHEAFPNAVLEALACGTPVIATPAPGGVREILADVAECVVAGSISAGGLAEAIKTWIARGRARVPEAATERYAVERIATQYEAILGGASNTVKHGGLKSD